MATMYCNFCNRPVEAKRHVGIGTLLLVLVTWGAWILAIPFYAKRCPMCKTTSLSKVPRR